MLHWGSLDIIVYINVLFINIATLLKIICTPVFIAIHLYFVVMMSYLTWNILLAYCVNIEIEHNLVIYIYLDVCINDTFTYMIQWSVALSFLHTCSTVRVCVCTLIALTNASVIHLILFTHISVCTAASQW